MWGAMPYCRSGGRAANGLTTIASASSGSEFLFIGAGVVIRRELPPPDDAASTGKAPIRGFIAEDPDGYTVEFFSWQTGSGS